MAVLLPPMLEFQTKHNTKVVFFRAFSITQLRIHRPNKDERITVPSYEQFIFSEVIK